jgi:plasmid stability protein
MPAPPKPRSQLIVRGLDPATVSALKRRAARHGRSAEAEHRAILREALAHEESRPRFKDLLRAMPHVGDDADFARARDLPRDIEL